MQTDPNEPTSATETYFIYTDASYHKGHSIGISGYLLFKNADDHEKAAALETDVTLNAFIEKNNIRAEIKGAILALKMALEFPAGTDLHLYTDCQTISNLQSRRKKLEGANFISKSKNLPLPNTDLYKTLYELFDKLKLQIHWVKGHTPANAKDTTQRNFSVLDRAVRKKLRQTIE